MYGGSNTENIARVYLAIANVSRTRFGEGGGQLDR